MFNINEHYFKLYSSLPRYTHVYTYVILLLTIRSLKFALYLYIRCNSDSHLNCSRDESDTIIPARQETSIENTSMGRVRFSSFPGSPDDDATGRLVGPKHPPHTPYRKVLYPPCCGVLCWAVPCRAVPCHAALRRGTVYRAILSRVAWLVVSFLYSFVGKSAASLVFKRRQRRPMVGTGPEMVGRDGETPARRGRTGRTEAKGKRRLVSGGCERGGSEGAGWTLVAW